MFKSKPNVVREILQLLLVTLILAAAEKLIKLAGWDFLFKEGL